MNSALALSATALAHGPGPGYGGPGWLLLLVPLLWIGILVLVVALLGRRWRRRAAEGSGSFGPPWAGAQAARGAEATLRERFVTGEIDETEFRARLEVLRSTAPAPRGR